MHIHLKRAVKQIGAVLVCLLLSVLTYDTYYRKICAEINIKEFREEREKVFDWTKSSMKEPVDEKHFFGKRPVKKISCIKLFAGNTSYIDKAKQIATDSRKRVTSMDYLLMTKDCDQFVYNRGYITDSLTEEEKELPIAYSILLYKDVEQAERLLRAIYRPQNTYCIHIDNDAARIDISAIRVIANCFDNVFVVNPLINVKWGAFSVLQADLLCMRALIKFKKWKYFINLTGQEFPLKTNYEVVKILQAYDGANDVYATKNWYFKLRWLNTIPPHSIKPTVGEAHVVVNRDFVEYVVYNQTANEILNWVRTTSIPDETYFSTLNHNPHLGIRGSYKGIPETEKNGGTRKPYLARFKHWMWENIPCAGKWVRLICVHGIGDLRLLSRRNELFANKFQIDFEPITLDCMEELIFNRTRDSYLKNITFDNTYYKNLDFVKNKVN